MSFKLTTLGLTALGLCVVAATPALVAAAEPASSHAPADESADDSACRLTWPIARSPNVGASENILWAATALSPDDAWAVGKYFVPGVGSRTLTQHWTGSSWRTVPSPDRDLHSSLDGVDGTSPRDVWAVGNSFAVPGDEAGTRTLIEHWDGQRWRIIPSPNKGIGAQGNGFLRGVTAISPDDAWAVGSYLPAVQFPTLQPLIEHWDGHQWRTVSTPVTGQWTKLKAVSASGPNDVWAVGVRDVRVGDEFTERALTLHWDGSMWKRVPTPVPAGLLDPFVLDDVVVLSPTNAWAVGTVADSTSHRTVVMHWNGTTWKIVPSSNPSAEYQTFAGVAAASRSQVWAVGSYWDASTGKMRTLVERWDGQRFRQAPTANRGESQLRAIAAVPHRQFAVGSAGLPQRTLILQHCTPSP